MQFVQSICLKTWYVKFVFFLTSLVTIVLLAAESTFALPDGFKEAVIVDNLNNPTAVAFAPDSRIFITEHDGNVRIVKDGVLLPNPFLNIRVTAIHERGLLGIAFDPEFLKNQYVYFYYTANYLSKGNPTPPQNRVSRFTANGDVAVLDSEVIILDDIPSPTEEHNGGCLRFGLDGKLYISTGDGGHGYGNNAQDLTSLNGKILRINSDGTVPDDNPFIGQQGVREEIWAYGLRNPWRFTIAPQTGVLIIGDVGDEIWEEVDIGEAGANYCWPHAEGPEPEGLQCTYPIYYYEHRTYRGFDIPSAVIGGIVYNGGNFPSEYLGNYFFGDYGLGFIWRMILDELYQAESVTIFDTRAFTLVDFAENPDDGTLYYVTGKDYRGRFEGKLVKIYYEP